MIDFKGKFVLITGASSGLGEEFARQFHALGSNVILVARRIEKLNAISSELNSKRDNSSEILCIDLTNTAELAKLTDFIKNRQIDILINNAGFGSLGYFEQIDIAHETKMIALNITSTLETAHAVIPQMKQRKEGAIISLSSVAAFQPMPFMSTYAATKAFNYFHSMGLRSELSDFNIRVLTVCPGPTDTEFFGAAHLSGMANKMKRDKPQDVVRESIAALREDKAYVVTGFTSKVASFFSNLCPNFLSSLIIKKILRP